MILLSSTPAEFNKDDEEAFHNETVRREIGKIQLQGTDSEVSRYIIARGSKFSDEHKSLIIDSWDFVSDFTAEVGEKATPLNYIG